MTTPELSAIRRAAGRKGGLAGGAKGGAIGGKARVKKGFAALSFTRRQEISKAAHKAKAQIQQFADKEIKKWKS